MASKPSCNFRRLQMGLFSLQQNVQLRAGGLIIVKLMNQGQCGWVFNTNPIFLQPRNRRTLCSSASSSARSSRIALQVQYKGTNYCGWEAKPELATIQSTLQHALFLITNSNINVSAASRTDARTHALGQVVHFDITEQYFANPCRWKVELNSRLPPEIRVAKSALAHADFDARRSAQWRTYHYVFRTDPGPNVFLDDTAWHYYQHGLDANIMNKAAALILCNKPRDLSAFRKTRAQARHTNIQVKEICVKREDNLVRLQVTANWFVYGMMRLLAATLVNVGNGSLSVEEFADIVTHRRRDKVLHSAPAHGLCLVRVDYSKELDPFLGFKRE